ADRLDRSRARGACTALCRGGDAEAGRRRATVARGADRLHHVPRHFRCAGGIGEKPVHRPNSRGCRGQLTQPALSPRQTVCGSIYCNAIQGRWPPKPSQEGPKKGEFSRMTANSLKPIKLVDPNNDKTVELPMISGSVGPEVMDIRKLYAET